MRIVQFSNNVAKTYGIPCKSAPFLHCALMEYLTSKDKSPILGYVVFVYDTREVVYYGQLPVPGAKHGEVEAYVSGRNVKDSHEHLKFKVIDKCEDYQKANHLLEGKHLVNDVNNAMSKLATESFVPAIEASGTVFAIDRYRQGFSGNEYYYYETLTTAYTNKDDAKKFLTEQKHCTATRQGYINEKDARSLYKIKELKLA